MTLTNLRALLKPLGQNVTVSKRGPRVFIRCDAKDGPAFADALLPLGLRYVGGWYSRTEPAPVIETDRYLYTFAVLGPMSTFVQHTYMPGLHVITSGEYGSEWWASTTIGMADVMGRAIGETHTGHSSHTRVTSTRELRAWERRMREINRPECADVIARALAS